MSFIPFYYTSEILIQYRKHNREFQIIEEIHCLQDGKTM